MSMKYVNDVQPTTEDIKAAWFYNIGVDPDDIDADPAVIAGWDHWLASVKAEAVAEFIDSTGVAPDGVRPLLAKAWDEGNAVDRRFNAPTPNPYREAKNV